MAKEKKKENKKEKKQKKKGNKDFIQELKIAYRNLDDPKKFYMTVFLPLIIIGVLIFCMPFILGMLIPIPIEFNFMTFIIGGIVPIILAVLYPFVSWKNKENDINAKMHFFITHIRVLSISDLSLKDIIDVLGGKTVYGALGEEMKKTSVLSIQWKMPLSKAFRFVSARTPSKLLKDFLDRFSQSLDSGVEHREFVEIEQEAVLQEYKTMYEASNENIVILNEVYVSMLIAIIFIMSMGIVLPIIMGTENMNMFIYMSSFMLIISEGMLLYLLKAMIPVDEIWHLTGETGELEKKMDKLFKISIFASIGIGIFFYLASVQMQIGFISSIPFEVLVAIAFTPLAYVGIIAFIEEREIIRKESNFLGFLPALGSIATMRGGKINDSVYYLSEKDYGVLTKHVKNLYRRLRTRINDDKAWEWFGVDTGSNYVQRSSEMFREATYAAANPRKVSKMIAENVRKIRNLRMKKLTIVNTSVALFAGITFGIAFSIYISLVIGQRLNEVVLETGDPYSGLEGMNNIGGNLLTAIPPDLYNGNYLTIFVVLVIHCFMLSLTLKTIRGSHKYITFLYFVPFIWIVSITSAVVQIFITGMMGPK